MVDFAHKKDLVKAYRRLGVNSKSTDREVNLAYRRLISQCHPDKTPPGLSPNEQEARTAQAATINAAFTLITRSRRQEDTTHNKPNSDGDTSSANIKKEQQIEATRATLIKFNELKQSALEIMPGIMATIQNINLIESARHKAAESLKNYAHQEVSVTSTARMVKATLEAFGAQTKSIMDKKERVTQTAQNKLEAVENNIAEFNDFWTENGTTLTRFCDFVSMLPEFSHGKLTPETALKILIKDPRLECLKKEVNNNSGSTVSRSVNRLLKTQAYKQTKAQLDAIDMLATIGPMLATKIKKKFGICIDQHDENDKLTLKDVFKGPDIHPYLWELDSARQDLENAMSRKDNIFHDDIQSMGPSLANSLNGIESIRMEGVNEHLSREQKEVLDYIENYYSGGYRYDKTIKTSTIEAATGEQNLATFESSVIFHSQQRTRRHSAINEAAKYAQMQHELNLMKSDLEPLVKQDFSSIDPADELAVERVLRTLQKPTYYKTVLESAQKLKDEGKLVNEAECRKVVYGLTGEQPRRVVDPKHVVD